MSHFNTVYNVIVIITMGFLVLFGLIPNMNHLEKWWVIFTIIFIKLLIVLPEKSKLVLVSLLSITNIRIPFLIILATIIVVGLSILNSFTFNSNMLSKNYRLFLTSGFNKLVDIKYKGHNFPTKQTIFVCNYPANLMEYLLYFYSLPGKCCIVVYAGLRLVNVIEMFCGKNSVIAISKGGQFDKTQKMINDKIKKGYNIMVYNETNFHSRYHIYHVNKLRTGIINIAKNLGVTITPIIFDHISHNFGFISTKKFKIYIGKTTEIDDVKSYVKSLRHLYLRKLRLYKIK